jgi:fatty-acyl-CoA synthase
MSTFPQELYKIYREIPDQPAIHLLFSRGEDVTLSYRSLLHGAAGVANKLEQEGIRPGEVVILILQHGENLLYGFWGAVLHGAIPSIMPFLTEKLSPDYYRAALKSLFEITAPAAVLTYAEFLPEVQEAILPGSSVRAVLVVDDLNPAEELDPVKLGGFTRLPDDIVLLQHSSGTTGLQKGVALAHQAVFNQLDNYRRAIHLQLEDVIVSWLPLYHDMGLIAGFILPVLCRVPLVLLSPFDWVRAPYRLMQAVSKYRGTLSWLPNFAYNFCTQKIRERDMEGVDLSSWRAVINCSEPMYYQSHQLFLEKFMPYGLQPSALATCYAMAENVFAVTQGGITEPVLVDEVSQPAFSAEHIARPPRTGEPAIHMLSAGRPIEGVQVRVLDEQRRVLPERQVGEIAIHSHCMLTGYYNRPDLTAKAFFDGWYLTGDLGYMANGEVFVTGRKKDLIIVGGKNVYPQDIEALVNDVPGVYPGRVSAFGIFSEESGTEEVVVLAEVETSDPEKRRRIADQVRLTVNKGSDIVLRYVELVDRNWLIKTSSGKVSRSANRQKYLNHRESTPTENQVR